MIKVLLVEEDPMVLKFHEHYLNQVKGYELVDKARTGEEALELLAVKSYDLVLLDIFMPGMDGLQLLKVIREQERNLDVIIISAAKDKEHIQTALRNGAVSAEAFLSYSVGLLSTALKSDIWYEGGGRTMITHQIRENRPLVCRSMRKNALIHQ